MKMRTSLWDTFLCNVTIAHLSLIESQYHVMHHFTCTSSHFIYCISRGMLNLYWGNWKIFEDKVWWASACSHSSNQASQPVAGHFNNGNHSVSDMKIRNPLSHFWKLCIVAAKDMKGASFLNVALSTLLALLGTFFLRLTMDNKIWFNYIYLCMWKADIDSTSNSHLILFFFHIFFCILL